MRPALLSPFHYIGNRAGLQWNFQNFSYFSSGGEREAGTCTRILQKFSEKLTLSAQVLRAENASLSQNQILYGYGCKFINMLSKHETMLRSFIFQQQRQQRNQE